MADRGFDYVAAPSGIDIARRSLTGSTPEWTQRFGYGASTLLYPQSELGDRALGYDLADAASQTDPNAAIFAALDEAQKAGYQQALFGGQSGDARQVPCVFGALSTEEWSVARTFQSRYATEIASLEVAVRQDPSYLELERQIASCLAAGGLNWTNRDQAEERFLALAASLGVDGLSDDELDRLAELQRDEIALAVAESECGGSNAARHERESAIRVELERQFVAVHAAQLDALALD